MKSSFFCITDLIDYLNNNLIISHYRGFNIMNRFHHTEHLTALSENLIIGIAKGNAKNSPASSGAWFQKHIFHISRFNSHCCKFLSNVQNQAAIPAIVNAEITTKKLAAVLNMLHCQMNTSSPLITNAFHSRKFTRFKSTGQERLWIHGINATKSPKTIAHIALLVTAVATKSKYSYSLLKSIKRIA